MAAAQRSKRIFTDYDGRDAPRGWTIDDDPGQELMRRDRPVPVLLL